MYIEAVPNRSSPPAVLLRESYREGGKVKKHTLANLSKLPPEIVEGLRALLRGGVVIEDLAAAVEVLDSWLWGHVRAVLGTARKIGLEELLSRRACPERSRVLAMIVARVLDPASKLATARSLGEEAHLAALRAELGLGSVDADQLYAALDWLFVEQPAIEKRLARRLAPLLFDDEDPAGAEALRSSVVAPARVSTGAQKKVHTLRTADGLPVHSFQTLLKALSRVTKTRLRIRLAPDSEPFEKLSGLAPLQQKAFSLLGLHP